MRLLSVTMLLLFASPALVVADDWPQAAGPNDNFQVDGQAATSFSVDQDDGVLWQVSLPNTGESTPVVSHGRIFLTCHTAMSADGESGRDILGLCFDAESGQQLWQRTLPASRTTDMASGFSDNTAASAVTDGKHVCFVNVGGSIRTYDFDGKLIWEYDWVPFGRHHARQQEPLLYDGKVILLKTVAADLDVTATTKAGAKQLGRDPKYWTRLHAFDLATGALEWVAESATSVHSLSMLNEMADGKMAILTGRGGGHQPPEEPYGLSLISADTGQAIWDRPIKGYAAHHNSVWNQNVAAAFVGMQHQLINIQDGVIQSSVSIADEVELRLHNDGQYTSTAKGSLVDHKRKRPTTYHTNCLIGDYHYFRSHHDFLIGRVHIGGEDVNGTRKLSQGKVEYLQVPVQVVRNGGAKKWLWDKSLKNDVRNIDGYVVYQDQRATLDGWGHVSAASPIVVGNYLYMPTMLGMVYVIRWDAEILDESALVSVSDLGPAQKTWTLSSLAYSDGKLYARTMKQLICIKPPSK
ncbi:MAG: PQQ-binding-like beta-propeller repeat protein [Fuerstiella sp.]